MSTMAAPATPIPIQVEMYAGLDLNANWVDISTDVLQDPGIQIGYGLPNEATSVQPCTMSLNLKNGDTYDPANPLGTYYGSIGRNTPMRISIQSDLDSFARTVASGWGTSDSGDVWQTFVGGTATFAVSAGSATQTVSAGGAWAAARTTAAWGDVDVAVTCSVLPGVSVTGAQIEPCNILLRGQDITHYYIVRVQISPTDQSISVIVLDANSLVIAGPVATGLAHVGSTSFRVRAQAEGQTIRAKIWAIGTSEPAAWLLTTNYMDAVTANNAVQHLDTPGFVGVRSGVAVGNTNTHPVAFTYDDFVVRVPRWAGWAMLQPTTDITGQYKTCQVTGGSMLRQLSQGQQPVQSPLRHDIPSLPHLVGYWPCEDGSTATSFASGMSSGGQPMSINGSPELASDSTFLASQPLPVNNNSYWFANVTPYTSTGQVQVRALFKFPPAATLLSPTTVLRFWTLGSGTPDTRWDLNYVAGGSVQLIATDQTGVVFTSGPMLFNVDGQAVRLSVELSQSGSDIAAAVETLAPGGNGGQVTFTITGRTITTCHAVAIGPPGSSLQQTVVGHITVESAVSSIFDLALQLNAFIGESAVSRLKRLAGYTNVEFDWYGDPIAKSVGCGAQTAGNLYSLIQTAAQSDGGLLYEAKGTPALVYRTGGAHSSPPIACALSRTTHDLSTPPTPTYDDATLVNDVTVTNQDGSTQEQALTTGSLSTQAPPNGVGSYPSQVQVSLQTQQSMADLAMWLLHLGTVPDGRYPQIGVNLLRPGNAALYWPLLDVSPDAMLSLAGQTPDTILLLARGYQESLSGFVHTLQFNCAPGAPYLVPVLDDGVSRWDAGASLMANPGMSTTSTSLVVTNNDGTIWTTNAADWPFDVTAGGERMTVTSVAAPSGGTQTLTVTRSVNGVVKAHSPSLGTIPVTLAQPRYWALGRQ